MLVRICRVYTVVSLKTKSQGLLVRKLGKLVKFPVCKLCHLCHSCCKQIALLDDLINAKMLLKYDSVTLYPMRCKVCATSDGLVITGLALLVVRDHIVTEKFCSQLKTLAIIK